MNRFYEMGRCLARRKFGSEHVVVTNDQTYQHMPDPAYINDAQAQGGAIDATWDAHDRRRHTQAIGPAVSPMAGGDG
jgi:hypothetical protein